MADDIKLPAGAAMRMNLRIMEIMEAAPKGPNGEMTEETRAYVHENVTREFGADMAALVLGDGTVTLDYSRRPPRS